MKGIVVAEEHGIDHAQGAMDYGLSGSVRKASRGVEGSVLGDGEVVPAPLPRKEWPYPNGEIERVAVKAAAGRPCRGGKQHGVLRGEPGQRVVMVLKVLRHDPMLRWREWHQFLAWVEQPTGGVCRVQVVI